MIMSRLFTTFFPMPIRILAMLAIFLSAIVSVQAHGPTPQKIDEQLRIDAPVEAVWAKVGDFSALASWHPQIEQLEMLDDTTRKITLADRGDLVESLDERDAGRHYLAYRLLEEDVSVFPVSYYSISIALTETGEATELHWQGRFYRADTGNFPPDHLNDAAAVNAMTEFARSGMAALKAQLEAGRL